MCQAKQGEHDEASALACRFTSSGAAPRSAAHARAACMPGRRGRAFVGGSSSSACSASLPAPSSSMSASAGPGRQGCASFGRQPGSTRLTPAAWMPGMCTCGTPSGVDHCPPQTAAQAHGGIQNLHSRAHRGRARHACRQAGRALLPQQRALRERCPAMRRPQHGVHRAHHIPFPALLGRRHATRPPLVQHTRIRQTCLNAAALSMQGMQQPSPCKERTDAARRPPRPSSGSLLRLPLPVAAGLALYSGADWRVRRGLWAAPRAPQSHQQTCRPPRSRPGHPRRRRPRWPEPLP